MRDETTRCCNCRFFDETMSDCHLNPPAFIGMVKDDEGLDSQWWAFPFIKRDWQDWCSHWQAADPSQTAEQRAVEIERLRKLDSELRY